MRQWTIVKAILGVSVFIFISIFLINGIEEEALRINIRLSARFAGILFCIAFGASAFQYFKKGMFSFWLLSNRKYFGISYALIHTIHLGFLGFLQFNFHPVFSQAMLTSLLGGGMAYLFTFLMLITSFDAIRQKIKPQIWLSLHTIGGYWIWSIFMISYIKRVDTELSYLPLIVLFVAVVVLRLLKLLNLGKS